MVRGLALIVSVCLCAGVVAVCHAYPSSNLPFGAKPSDRRVACWVVRDFGTDEQFGRLVSAIRQSQYEDRQRYDELWSATIGSDNNRENEVLEILLADQRVVQGNKRYSDIARGELARIKARGVRN